MDENGQPIPVPPSLAVPASASVEDFAAGQALSGTFTLPAGASSTEIVLAVAGDEIPYEGAETFTVVLSNLDLANLDPEESEILTLADADATGTIIEPPPPPTAILLGIADSGILEPPVDQTQPITFTLYLTDQDGRALTLEVPFSGSWRVEFPSDFPNPASAADFAGGQALSGVFTFPAGASSTEITLQVIGDDQPPADDATEPSLEGDELFTIKLSGLDLAGLDPEQRAIFAFSTDVATGTIIDPFGATVVDPIDLETAESSHTLPQLGATTYLVREPFSWLASPPAASYTYLLTLRHSDGRPMIAAEAITGTWSFAVPTAEEATEQGGAPASAADFGGTLPGGSFTIAKGESSTHLNFSVIDDDLREGVEYFKVVIATEAEVRTPETYGSIISDRFTVGFAGDSEAPEKATGNAAVTTMPFTVEMRDLVTGRRSNPSQLFNHNPQAVYVIDADWEVRLLGTDSGPSPKRAAAGHAPRTWSPVSSDADRFPPAVTSGFFWGPQSNTTDTISVPMRDDSFIERAEQFEVVLKNLRATDRFAGPRVISQIRLVDDPAVGTIKPQRLYLVADDATVYEPERITTGVPYETAPHVFGVALRKGPDPSAEAVRSVGAITFDWEMQTLNEAEADAQARAFRAPDGAPAARQDLAPTRYRLHPVSRELLEVVYEPVRGSGTVPRSGG